jgi:hypothetical protein
MSSPHSGVFVALVTDLTRHGVLSKKVERSIKDPEGFRNDRQGSRATRAVDLAIIDSDSMALTAPEKTRF